MDQTVPLREYIESRLSALETHMQVRLDAIQKSIDVSDDRLKVRLEGMNEWRATLADRSAEYAKQTQVTSIQKWIDTAGGRSQALTILATVLSIAAMAVTLWKASGLGHTP